MTGGFDLAGAVRQEAERIARDNSSGHLALVVDVDPLVLELMDSRHTIHEEEVLLSQWVKHYHATYEIDEGDTVTLMRKKRNGEVVWIVTDVVADKDPA